MNCRAKRLNLPKLSRLEGQKAVLGWVLANAAPEWQARSIGRCSRELTVACPLEGLVRLRWCLRPRLFLNVEFERPELFVFLFL